MAKIYFIGAYPGDPELITIKGQRIIAEADVIIYAGSLVNPEILKYGKKDVPVYNSATMNLDEVLKVELESMHKGKTVARVHTGILLFMVLFRNKWMDCVRQAWQKNRWKWFPGEFLFGNSGSSQTGIYASECFPDNYYYAYGRPYAYA